MDLSPLIGLFVGAHVILAKNTRTPELVLSDEEAEQFMERAQNVLRHYSVTTTQKALDWIAFMGVASFIYMPRVVAISARHRNEREQRTGKIVHPPQFRRPTQGNGHEPELVIEPEIDPEAI